MHKRRRRDSITGDLIRIGDLAEQRTHAGGKCIIVSPDNKNVYLFNYSGNAILTYGVLPVSMKSQRDYLQFDDASDFYVVKTGMSYFITFYTRATGRTELSLFDLQGKLLQKIFNQYSTPGRYSVKENFSSIRNGNYLLCLVNEKQCMTKRITIIN